MGKDVWSCFPIVLSHCYDILRGSNMSSLINGITVRRHCVICLVAMDDIPYLQKSDGLKPRKTVLRKEE